MIHGGESDRKVNMDFSVNLNPLGTPEAVKDAILEGIQNAGSYPEYEQRILRHKLSKLEGIRPEQIIAGNGASELIMAAVRAINPKKAVIVEPAFYGYRHALTSLGECEIEEYILEDADGFALNAEKSELIDIIKGGADVIFLANPGNPTGQNIEEKTLEMLINTADEHNCAVVLDESFLLLSQSYNVVDINRTSQLLGKYPKLYILRSFTKLMSIPGIRIGYIMSTGNNITQIKKQLSEWNISQPADYAGRACAEVIANTDFVSSSIDYVNRERAYLSSELKARGYDIYRSDTVYIMLKNQPSVDDESLFDKLLDKGILIRDCSNFAGLKKGYYRIAVKDHESNVKLIEALDEIRE